MHPMLGSLADRKPQSHPRSDQVNFVEGTAGSSTVGAEGLKSPSLNPYQDCSTNHNSTHPNFPAFAFVLLNHLFLPGSMDRDSSCLAQYPWPGCLWEEQFIPMDRKFRGGHSTPWKQSCQTRQVRCTSRSLPQHSHIGSTTGCISFVVSYWSHKAHLICLWEKCLDRIALRITFILLFIHYSLSTYYRCSVHHPTIHLSIHPVKIYYLLLCAKLVLSTLSINTGGLGPHF